MSSGDRAAGDRAQHPRSGGHAGIRSSTLRASSATRTSWWSARRLLTDEKSRRPPVAACATGGRRSLPAPGRSASPQSASTRAEINGSTQSRSPKNQPSRAPTAPPDSAEPTAARRYPRRPVTCSTTFKPAPTMDTRSTGTGCRRCAAPPRSRVGLDDLGRTVRLHPILSGRLPSPGACGRGCRAARWTVAWRIARRPARTVPDRWVPTGASDGRSRRGRRRRSRTSCR